MRVFISGAMGLPLARRRADVLDRIANELFVARQLRAIFSYREQMIRSRFGGIVP